MAVKALGCVSFRIEIAQDIAFASPIQLGFALPFGLKVAHALIV